MRTHNIDFYEDLTKIIFQLSSSIIKYAPYLFFCSQLTSSVLVISTLLLSALFFAAARFGLTDDLVFLTFFSLIFSSAGNLDQSVKKNN